MFVWLEFNVTSTHIGHYVKGHSKSQFIYSVYIKSSHVGFLLFREPPQDVIVDSRRDRRPLF